jgi:hypothetical protein
VIGESFLHAEVSGFGTQACFVPLMAKNRIHYHIALANLLTTFTSFPRGFCEKRLQGD